MANAVLLPFPLLEVDGLVRSFSPESTVLSGISFALNEGEVLLVRGPSGVGKTQLLRAIASLDELQGGQLRLHGKTPNQLGQPNWRTQVMYVPQTRVSYTGSPADLYYTAQRLNAQRGKPRGDLPALIHALGLEQSVLNQPWSELSGGQSQRAMLAVALALRPLVLLVDEPTSACDAANAARVEATLLGSGTALIWVTHDDGLATRMPRGSRVLQLPLGMVAILGHG